MTRPATTRGAEAGAEGCTTTAWLASLDTSKDAPLPWDGPATFTDATTPAERAALDNAPAGTVAAEFRRICASVAARLRGASTTTTTTSTDKAA